MTLPWPAAAGVIDLREQFDLFLVDQFGTLHDGRALYPGVAESLRLLMDSGAGVVLLSNSGKRAQPNIDRLTALGVAPDLYGRFVTSGEVAWQMLHAGALPAARGARRCLVLDRGGDGGLLDGLALELVAQAGAAQLVLIAGSEGDRASLESYAEQLAPAARAGVPALCLNPDRTMLTASGTAFGAGRIAELYESLGGPVTWIGKPHAAIYDAVLRDAERARTVGIGDSIEHDIAGAQAAGARGWLLRNGIIAQADDAALLAEAARVGATPDGILAAF